MYNYRKIKRRVPHSSSTHNKRLKLSVSDASGEYPTYPSCDLPCLLSNDGTIRVAIM